MANYKYYIEPTVKTRGGEESIKFHAQVENVLIDLGQLEHLNARDEVIHQCFSLVDGHVEVPLDYLKGCEKISREDFSSITEGYNVEGYVEEDFFTLKLSMDYDVCTSLYEHHIDVYDLLPYEVHTSEVPAFTIQGEVLKERIAEYLGYSMFSIMVTTLSFASSYVVIPKKKVLEILEQYS